MSLTPLQLDVVAVLVDGSRRLTQKPAQRDDPKSPSRGKPRLTVLERRARDR